VSVKKEENVMAVARKERIVFRRTKKGRRGQKRGEAESHYHMGGEKDVGEENLWLAIVVRNKNTRGKAELKIKEGENHASVLKRAIGNLFSMRRVSA